VSTKVLKYVPIYVRTYSGRYLRSTFYLVRTDCARTTPTTRCSSQSYPKTETHFQRHTMPQTEAILIYHSFDRFSTATMFRFVSVSQSGPVRKRGLSATSKKQSQLTKWP
jgi:hypothetical protein